MFIFLHCLFNSYADFIIAFSYAGTVFRVNDSGTTPIWRNLENPFGIAIDSDRNLYVYEQTAGRISNRAHDGTVTVITNKFTNPEGICIGPDGTLLVADTPAAKLFIID